MPGRPEGGKKEAERLERETRGLPVKTSSMAPGVRKKERGRLPAAKG